MGQWQKRNNENFMGEPTDKEATRPGKGAEVKTTGFKLGDVLEGLPNQKDDYPKDGKDIAPSFQMLREQSSSKGKI